MSNDARILELVQEALDSHLTPEQVCANDPDLLQDVKTYLTECQSVDVMIEGMFPSNSESSPSHVRLTSDTPFPKIPGYQVLEVLGRGGIGVIYRVRHLKLQRDSALKMLLSGEFASQTELARFMREAQAVAALKHPNIVQVYYAGELDGRPFFTMELVEGGSLARKTNGKPQDVHQSAILVATLARAIQFAHDAGIIHRDLKPGNILLTTDGVPKISDFGLASRSAQESSLTVNGARLGTPSYMAPEQATGAHGEVKAAVDIYALGAILYEMLTGVPPFHGATAVETQRKVVSDEPQRPSRLNSKVPRDLETICLKCLNKSPGDRYESAAALADDLDRFLQLQPIRARHTGILGRAGKWVRRRPAVAVAIAVSVLLFLVAGAGAWWFESQRAHLVLAVDNDLNETRAFERAGRWTNAEAALHRAEARLDVRSAQDLRQHVNEARSDLQLAARLDAIHLSRTTAGGLTYYWKQADADYEKIFAEAIHIPMSTPVDQAAKQVKESTARDALVAALDDWATCAADSQRRSWILNVARESDPDPEWRDRIRDPEKWNDKTRLGELDELARAAPVSSSSMPVLMATGEYLNQAGRDSSALLRRVQREHPAEFWPNLILGEALIIRAPAEAANYFRAALAARPEAAAGYDAVGDTLVAKQDFEDALDYYSQALALDPKYARAKTNLARALVGLGRFDEAIEACNQSLRLDPNYVWAHFNLALALKGLGHPQEALDHLAITYGLLPDSTFVQETYRTTLIQSGHADDARAIWEKTLSAGPASFDSWTGYPELCLFAGNEKAYRQARQSMLEQFSSSKDARIEQQLARACLLLPASKDDADVLQQATVLADRALKATSSKSWTHPYYAFVAGLAEYRNGHLDQAIAMMSDEVSSVLGPCPKLVEAMALKDKGNDEASLQALADAAVKFDWRLAHADSRDLWIYHILRREAEAKILQNLPSLVDGSQQPQDNYQRLAAIPACQFQNRPGRCVQFFTEAFANEPDLIDKRRINPGFTAACAACALALRDNGEDRPGGAAFDRAELQKLAYGWLNDQLTIEMHRERPSDSPARPWLARELTLWKQDPGLAGIRNPIALQSTTPEIRNECATFWQSLDTAIARLQDQGKAGATTAASN
jgi:serine/threonine-protein kinase